VDPVSELITKTSPLPAKTLEGLAGSIAIAVIPLYNKIDAVVKDQVCPVSRDLYTSPGSVPQNKTEGIEVH
jgi:hypothetical protein